MFNGGYIQLAPITYPTAICYDAFGNPTNTPIAQPGYPAFGANDVILWNSLSPLPGVSPGGCSAGFTPNVTYGLNVNTYIWALGGFASEISAYNAFDAAPCGSDASCATGPTGQKGGGMHALSFTANNYVNTGNYAGPPPLTTYDSFNAGAQFWDTTAACPKVYSGAAWLCIVTTSNVGSFVSTATGTTNGFATANGKFAVNGNGAVSAEDVIASTGATGGCNVTTDTAYNSIQTVGGILSVTSLVTGQPSMTGLSVFANNAAAVAGGLVAGNLYRTGATPDAICVVH